MTLPIIGLVSSYREAELGHAAARSLGHVCKRVLVLEGPIVGGMIDDAIPSLGERWPSTRNTQVRYEVHDSDAAKRTALLRWAQDVMSGAPFWALFLDGDEQLVNGHNLPLWARRAELEPWNDDLRVTGGFPLRIVELDGSTVTSSGRIFRGDQVERFELSSVQIKLKGSDATVAAGNVPNWLPGEEITGYNRPPLQGEPHILHLHPLRDPAREAVRQSEAEIESTRAQAERLGIALPEWST